MLPHLISLLAASWLISHSLYTLPLTYLHTHLSAHPPIHSSIHPSTHTLIHPSTHLSTHPPIHPSTHLSIHLPIFIPTHRFIHPSNRVCLPYLSPTKHWCYYLKFIGSIRFSSAFRAIICFVPHNPERYLGERLFLFIHEKQCGLQTYAGTPWRWRSHPHTLLCSPLSLSLSCSRDSHSLFPR